MARIQYESDGLKIMEDLTNNADQIQQRVLSEILTRNAATEYLKRFLNAQIDNQLFKKIVPIVSYEDIRPYIDRIANGEPSDILLADPVIEFHISTGTSGGKPKLIPATADVLEKRVVFNTLLGSVMRKHVGDPNQGGKGLQFLFVKPEIETPCGLKARAVSTSALKDDTRSR
ncbi:GH3 auxin-responsive promoter [Corchorus olitorius]|uniref:GH3 auxin-responsive promoter n=1 Tax=Corchorus olitorius TaxID=93759 RepID=A0A1R3K213_9ROSI|nr:GH3 auxin-responsive promoter [Corchorus olitorius]